MTFPGSIGALAARVGSEIKALREVTPGASLLQGAETLGLRRNREWAWAGGRASSGNIPARDWQAFGALVPAGRTITGIHISGFLERSGYDDVELNLSLRRPADWQAGASQDNDILVSALYAGPWLGPGFDPTRHHLRQFPVNITLSEAAYFIPYARPIAAQPRRNIDFLMSWSISII